MLGLQRLWGGAGVFRDGGEEGAAMLSVRVCDVVVMLCASRRLEMALARIGSFLFLFLG